ncbi:MAG: YwbE family protein [bacterium]|nr:YwbE family protein [bacterium]
MVLGRNNFDNPKPPKRSEIRPGDAVWVIEKEKYGTQDYTQGIVKDVLSPGDFHPRGIKVRLMDGTIGRVQWKMTE